MADLHPLSSNLSTFKGVYDGSFSNMRSKQSDISNTLSEVINSIDSAINGFTTAGSDSQITSLKSCLTLAKDGTERVKSHVDGDLTNLFSNGDEVRGNDSGQEIIGEIVKLINDGKNWKESFWQRVWNAIREIFTDEYIENDQAKIDRANQRIDHLNKKGEAQLAAMSSAINSVAFGVAGNMKNGGSLGTSITYEEQYEFNAEAWEQANPEVHLNILQQAGCAVVGAVEGVAHVAEGILDVGATALAGVVSWFNADAGQAIADFAARDLSAETAAGLMDITSGITGITGDAYLASGGRRLGRGAGELVAHGALWLTGGGAILSAVSIAGNSMESNLQAGNGIGRSFFTGAVTGVASYALGKAGQAIASKFAGWATGSGSTTVIGKVYNAAAKAITTPFKDAHGLGGKLVSIVTSPLRFTGNMMQRGANFINRTVGTTGAFQVLNRADAAASGTFNRLFHVNSGATGATRVSGDGGAGDATRTPADGDLASTVDANKLSRGSMTADGRYHPAANTNGAPTDAASSAFNNMPGSDGDLAIGVDPRTLTTGGSMTADGMYHTPAALNGAPADAASSAFNNLPIDGTSAFNVDPAALSAGSMTADGMYHMPASLNGAPTDAATSAFNVS